MGSKRPSSPPARKRRRRNHNNNNNASEIKDDGILDLTTYKHIVMIIIVIVIVTMVKENIQQKIKYHILDQLWLPNQMVNLMLIRNEVFEFVNNQKKVKQLLELAFNELKRRALGADICYSKQLNSRDKLVLVRQEYLSHINWASKPEEKGGGGTRFSPIENISLVDGACPIVARFWQPLKCQPALGILASGNIGKLHPIYVFLILLLGYGEKYASLVQKRSRESLSKRMKTLMTKKTTNSDAVKVRTIFIKWGSPTDVTKTNIECITKSTITADLPQTEEAPKAESQPCLPVKLTKKPTSKQVQEKALDVLNKIEKEMAKIKREDEEKQEYIPKDMASIPNVIAMPPIPTTVPTQVSTATTTIPPNTNDVNINGLQLYGYISIIYEMKNENGITDQIKESTVSMLLKAWHSNDINNNKEHVMNLISFIQKQSGLSDSAILRLLRVDLTEFLKANKK